MKKVRGIGYIRFQRESL